MIAFLTGRFVLKNPALVHIDVGGIGYEVQISLNTYTRIQAMNEGTLFTWLQIREDAHILYGFHDMAEKNMFLQLISISGVGAATARMMLSSLLPEEIAGAIARSEVRVLESIKGIGRKTAERIVLELRDKVMKADLVNTSSSTANNTLQQDALNALIALGIARNTAEAAIKKASASVTPTESLENLIKKSLQFI